MDFSSEGKVRPRNTSELALPRGPGGQRFPRLRHHRSAMLGVLWLGATSEVFGKFRQPEIPVNMISLCTNQ